MKVALYIRVSKSDGSQDTTRQLSQLRSFAKSQKWKIVEEIEEYISGRITNRSGTKKLITLAKSNKIQKVLIHEISRLGRNLADICNTVEELTQNKVSVFDYSQKLETLDKNYNKTLYATIIMPIFSGIAEQWLEQHRYRIKSGLEQARLKGQKLGRPEQEKIKKEDDILELRQQGKINNKKATYNRIAEHLEISPDTVRRVLKKHRHTLCQKKMKVQLSLCVENNSSFVRGIKRSIESIENHILYERFPDLKDLGDNEYTFTVTYKDKEDLDNQMYELLSDMESEADYKHCHLDSTTISSLDDEYLHW